MSTWRGKTALDRFWGKVSRGTPDACWPRSGANTHGYSQLTWEGRWRLATHVSWFLEHGMFPPAGQFVLHRCDNPPCVNPAHLWLGTKAENRQDMCAKNRQRYAIGVDASVAKLNDEWVRQIRFLYEDVGGYKIKELARSYGVSPAAIKGVLERRTWRHVHG